MIAKNEDNQRIDGLTGIHPEIIALEGMSDDAKALYEAFKVFNKHGLTQKEAQKLQDIDAVLDDASIQIVKDGSAIITDSNGKVAKISGR